MSSGALRAHLVNITLRLAGGIYFNGIKLRG